MKLAETRLLVDDFPTMLAFYRDVLQLPISYQDGDENYVSFASNDEGVTVALFKRADMGAAIDATLTSTISDRVTLSFCVDNTDELVAQLAQRGVSIVYPPTDRPEWGGMRTAHLRDPEGNLIEIFHQPETA